MRERGRAVARAKCRHEENSKRDRLARRRQHAERNSDDGWKKGISFPEGEQKGPRLKLPRALFCPLEFPRREAVGKLVDLSVEDRRLDFIASRCDC